MKIKSILVSQPEPVTPRSPYFDLADKYKLKIPVFVAGGIYDQQDIKYAIDQGAEGVAIGTRFAATHESQGSGYHLP